MGLSTFAAGIKYKNMSIPNYYWLTYQIWGVWDGSTITWALFFVCFWGCFVGGGDLHFVSSSLPLPLMNATLWFYFLRENLSKCLTSIWNRGYWKLCVLKLCYYEAVCGSLRVNVSERVTWVYVCASICACAPLYTHTQHTNKLPIQTTDDSREQVVCSDDIYSAYSSSHTPHIGDYNITPARDAKRRDVTIRRNRQFAKTQDRKRNGPRSLRSVTVLSMAVEQLFVRCSAVTVEWRGCQLFNDSYMSNSVS